MRTPHDGTEPPADPVGGRAELAATGIDPFWTLIGGWAVACGAVASKGFRWRGEDALALALVFLLVCLAWASLWNSLTHGGWLRRATGKRHHVTSSAVRHTQPTLLPFGRAGAPAHRLAARAGRLLDRWRPGDGTVSGTEPAGGSVWVSALIALLLAAVLTLRLPPRLSILNAAFVVLVALGAAQALRGRASAAGQSCVSVALGWLAGHLAFAPFQWSSAALALLFSLASWGAIRCADCRRGGVWLLDGSHVAVVALLAVLKQPLAAGAAGLMLAGQIALQPSLLLGGEPSRVSRRTWPWLLAAMMIAAWAVP